MSAQPTLEQALVRELALQFKDQVKASSSKPKRFKVTVNTGDLVKFAEYLRHKMGFDHVHTVSGTDYPKEGVIEVVYHIGSYSRMDLRNIVGSLATKVPRDAPTLPSLIGIWNSCEYHERETHEMLGVVFVGHPNLTRLLLPEDWSDIPPLRKDFALPGR